MGRDIRMRGGGRSCEVVGKHMFALRECKLDHAVVGYREVDVPL
jgi:hypothetical protein